MAGDGLRVASTLERMQLDFRLDDRSDVYVAALSGADAGEPIVVLRLPRTDIDRIVLDAVKLELELTGNGRLAVFAEVSDAGTLATASLAGLAEEAIAVMADEDAAVELAALEDALQNALDTVRKERERRGRKV